MVSSSLLPFNGALFQSIPHPPTVFFQRGLRRGQDASLVIPRTAHSTRGQAFQILANPNVSAGKGNSDKEVVMVDPLEAKRLAAKQMQEFKAKEKLKCCGYREDVELRRLMAHGQCLV
ncbi:uncharacterized protein LOC100246766 isoform X2 [Vitis vinifera]|uniref:uncharacterized protein LOC100246766 isoform X2 n=1 Tax=Vitis vinifera TaxID=29760 RepID=UPI00053F9854|nr:uncharacterized protein LOC100246766 isoform X2 [Vitis vinifera]